MFSRVKLCDMLKKLYPRLVSDQARFVWAVIYCLFLGSLFVTDNVRLHRNVYYVLVLVPFALQVNRTFAAALIRSPVFLASAAFLTYLWITLFWSSVDAGYVFYNEARTLVIMLSFLAVTALYAATTDGFLRMLARVLAGVAGVCAVVSLYVFYVDRDLPMIGGLESRAVDIGLAGHPIDSAGLYGFVAVFLVFSVFIHARWNTIWTWFCGLSLLAIFSFIGMTQTRAAILGIVVVLGLGLLFQGSRRLWVALGALGVLTLGLIAVSWHHPEGMLGFERRLGVRGEIWTLALERAWERPWFGFGLNEHQQLFLGSGEHQGVAHSLYLEILHFGGVTGALFLLLLAGLALRGAWREYRRTGNFLLPALILYPLIFGVFAGYLTLSKISPMWIQFWLPVGLVMGMEIREHISVNAPSSGQSRNAPPHLASFAEKESGP